MANKPFSDRDRSEVEAWVRAQFRTGKSVRQIRAEARQKFGAFDWNIIVNLIMEIIKAWLSRK